MPGRDKIKTSGSDFGQGFTPKKKDYVGLGKPSKKKDYVGLGKPNTKKVKGKMFLIFLVNLQDQKTNQILQVKTKVQKTNQILQQIRNQLQKVV